MRRALRAIPSRVTWLIFAPVKSGLKAFVLKQVVLRAIQGKGKEGSDIIGTLHFAYFVPFENNHLGFFTIYDGYFEQYIQDFADKIGPTFDAVFEFIRARRRAQ